MLGKGVILASSSIFFLVFIIPSIYGGSTYGVYVYVDELPSWASYASNVVYLATEDWKDANSGLEFYKANNQRSADVHIQWVKEFGTDERIGQTVDGWLVEVGLGDSWCTGDWQPYSENHVRHILSHELGHVFGHDHNNNPDSIMYPIALNKEYGIVEQEFTLTESYGQFVPFCTIKGVTSFDYSVSVDDPTYGFDIYVVPSGDSLDDWAEGKSFQYYSGQGCSAKNYRVYSDTCEGVAQGSGLLIIMDDVLTEKLTTITVKTQEVFTDSSKQRLSYAEPTESEFPSGFGIKFEDESYADYDNDGIGDYRDECMYTKETFNGYQDTDGCPDTHIDISDKSNDELFKTLAFLSESNYQLRIDELRKGIETAEESLSNLEYESQEAQKKIKHAWDVRWSALERMHNIDVKYSAGVYEMDKENFETAVNYFKGIDYESEQIGSNLRIITETINQAENLEKNYLGDKAKNQQNNQGDGSNQNSEEKEKFCFLFWCW